MTAREKLNCLRNKLRTLEHRQHDDAWEEAQNWKEEAHQTVADIFSKDQCFANDTKTKIEGLFTSAPSFVMDGHHSPSLPDDEQQRIFESSISEAKEIIGSCISELERLASKYSI